MPHFLQKRCLAGCVQRHGWHKTAPNQSDSLLMLVGSQWVPRLVGEAILTGCAEELLEVPSRRTTELATQPWGREETRNGLSRSEWACD
jgi:hypothetical protein